MSLPEASSVYAKASVYSGADRRMEMVSAEPSRIMVSRSPVTALTALFGMHMERHTSTAEKARVIQTSKSVCVSKNPGS